MRLRTSILSHQCNEVAIEFLDGNNARGCPRAQNLFPFIDFLLIDLAGSVYYRGIGNDPHARVCVLENLEAKKMIGVLMTNVDIDSGFLDSLISCSTLSALVLSTVHRLASLVCSLDNDGVNPELIVERSDHFD